MQLLKAGFAPKIADDAKGYRAGKSKRLGSEPNGVTSLGMTSFSRAAVNSPGDVAARAERERGRVRDKGVERNARERRYFQTDDTFSKSTKEMTL